MTLRSSLCSPNFHFSFCFLTRHPCLGLSIRPFDGGPSPAWDAKALKARVFFCPKARGQGRAQFWKACIFVGWAGWWGGKATYRPGVFHSFMPLSYHPFRNVYVALLWKCLPNSFLSPLLFIAERKLYRWSSPQSPFTSTNQSNSPIGSRFSHFQQLWAWLGEVLSFIGSL